MPGSEKAIRQFSSDHSVGWLMPAMLKLLTRITTMGAKIQNPKTMSNTAMTNVPVPGRTHGARRVPTTPVRDRTAIYMS